MDAEPVPDLFSPDVVVLTAPVDERAVSGLTPAEANAIPRARDKRRREYATGRCLARDALRRLGVEGFDLVNGEDRAPIWPEGIAGTITHSDTRAVVAVGRRARIGTVGLDIEHREGLARPLWRMTLLPAEVAFLDARRADERERWALIVFSAKEALYKAQYPVSGEYMGFSALRVELAPDPDAPLSRGAIRCEFQRDVGPFPRGFVASGRYRPIGPDVVTGVTIPPR